MGEYRRGFGVVEVELSFLHDHIHGGYVLWSRTHRASYYVLAGLKELLMYAGPALYIAVAASHPDSVSITLLVLHGLLDLLQVIFYCSSDRWMVSYMCRAHHQKDGLMPRQQCVCCWIIFCIVLVRTMLQETMCCSVLYIY